MDSLDRYILHEAGFPQVPSPRRLSPKQWCQIPDRAYVDRLLLPVWKAAQADPRTPPETLAELQSAATGLTATVMMLRHNLLRAVQALEAAGIETCTLKGVGLAQRLYGDSLARQCNDIDLMVQPEDRERAEAALAEAGFAPETTFEPGLDHHVSLFRTVGQTKVHLELHAGVNLGNTRAFPQEWWEARVPLQFGAQAVQIFRDDHLLVFLCVHAAVHGYGSLGWLADITALLPRLACSNRQIVAAAQAARRTCTVYHTLSLLRSLGAPVDADLLAALRPRTDRTWLIRFLLFRGPRSHTQFCRLIAILAMADRRESGLNGWFFPSFRFFRKGYPRLSTPMAVLLYGPWLIRGMARAAAGVFRAGLAWKRL